jgi:hypothetical protein
MSEITLASNDGFAVPEKSGGSAIVGKLVKFSVDGRFVVDKTEPMAADTTLVAMAVVTAWVCWKDGRLVEHRITQPGQYHPDREELGNLDEKAWEVGLNDKPSDPWRDTRYLHLMDPQTGADFTFVTDTFGGRRGIGDLKSQIANVRSSHPASVPILKLCSTPWKTKFGVKQRPEFKVVGWRGRQETITPEKQRKPFWSSGGRPIRSR